MAGRKSSCSGPVSAAADVEVARTVATAAAQTALRCLGVRRTVRLTSPPGRSIVIWIAAVSNRRDRFNRGTTEMAESGAGPRPPRYTGR
ncbi:hypothetical protein GCM10010302_43090 [Streptomyces polychromogenes]|uniref:Uncharacterized protein n=1 Tax=Streptomyces polychromogenes TaxID=67342 RepID=A0ABN0VHC5_9ACTN